MITRTFATLEVSAASYDEIYELLAIAGYHQVFIDEAIDMHGIALVKKEQTEKEKQLAEFAKDIAKTVVRQIINQAK